MSSSALWNDLTEIITSLESYQNIDISWDPNTLTEVAIENMYGNI